MNQLPLTLTEVRARRDEGIDRAAEHAGPAWKERARIHLLQYLAVHTGPFLAEDVRWYAEDCGLPYPPDGRAWGDVMRSAAKADLIRKVGYAPAKSSNLSPKVQWVRAC